MKDALTEGHDVQLHLHPHWLNSSFNDGEWLISTDKMYLHELGYNNSPDSAGALISRGVKYLNDLLRPVQPNYTCLAFRAAGSALQPDEDKLIKTLLDSGIKMDVSIIRDMVFKLDTVTVNYTKIPQKTIWFMSPESGISREADLGLIEIPVASFKSDFLSRIGFLLRRAGSVGQMRGTIISRSGRQGRLANLKTLLLYNLRYVASSPSYMISCDTKGYNSRMLLAGFKQYIKRHNDEKTIFVTMINHPKLMFAYQIDMLGTFINETRKEYDIEFSTCSKVFEKFGRQV
jgi:hypothetical protein